LSWGEPEPDADVALVGLIPAAVGTPGKEKDSYQTTDGRQSHRPALGAVHRCLACCRAYASEIKIESAMKWQLLPVPVVCGTLSGKRRCAMQSMNISLPDPLKQFVDGQIAQGRYSSVSEYVRELIRADEKRKAEEQLEAKLLEGLSGAESELTAADWSAIRREALAKVEARKNPR
jgi:antitoxin ParD1/3/4